MNYALIFAGGVGNRMGSITKPKQFLEINNKPIIVYTIEKFNNHNNIDQICVVIVEEWIDYMKELIEKYNLNKVKWVVSGGNTALDSQYIGLQTIKNSNKYDENGVVLIHDGVRPLINDKLIDDCIESAKKYGSGITIAPAIETIIQTDDNNMIKETYSRNACKLARAPQTYIIGNIVSVFDRAVEDNNMNFVDSVTLMLNYGKNVYTVEGPAENIKVTTMSDFYACEALLNSK